jgi:polyhydroxyalkanoate synthase
VAALALLGAPIDFHRSGELARWTERGRFDADAVIDAFGNMPPWLMQSGFKLLGPLEAFSRAATMFRHADDAPLVRLLAALDAWLEDNVAFPGGVYREYIGALYQDNALWEGRFSVAGRRVDLAALTAPLLDVIALRDRICAPASSRALMERAGSTDRTLLEFDAGHIGITTSPRAQTELWPEIASWLLERCGR